MTAGGGARLEISLSAPERARLGSTIPIVIRLENRGDDRLELYLRGRTPAFDIAIRDEGGDLVWQRLENEIIPGILQIRMLEPGQSLDLSHQWRQRGNRGQAIRPGLYTVQGFVLTDRLEPMQSPIRQIVIEPV